MHADALKTLQPVRATRFNPQSADTEVCFVLWQITEYNIAVPSKTVRVRLNGMSYTAAAVKIGGMTGNMRVVDFSTDSAAWQLTLHGPDDSLMRTYTFQILRTTAGPCR
eukprot:839248-Pyramimonas_sp.AAC.1